MRMIIVLTISLLNMNSCAMESSVISCAHDTSDRAYWQSFGPKENLKRGSLAVDVKTLVKTVPRIFKNKESAIPDEWVEKEIPNVEQPDCALTWIGHATFLLQSGTLHGVIDPFWGNYTLGPFTLYKRLLPAALDKEDVPPLTFIALTHNHIDHCDTEALLFFCKRDNPIVLVPEGDQEYFAKLGFTKIVACQWGDKVYLKNKTDSVACSFLPAAHDSDRNAWWGSWLFKTQGINVYHAGDTGDALHFEAIATRHTIDIALLPIAPYTMRELQQAAHIDQKEAINVFERLHARLLIPMHCCTLPYCNDDAQECIAKLHEEWRAKDLPQKMLIMFKFGKIYNVRKLMEQLRSADSY